MLDFGYKFMLPTQDLFEEKKSLNLKMPWTNKYLKNLNVNKNTWCFINKISASHNHSTCPTAIMQVDAWRVGLDAGRVSLDAGRVGLDAGRVGLDAGRVVLDAGWGELFTCLFLLFVVLSTL